MYYELRKRELTNRYKKHPAHQRAKGKVRIFVTQKAANSKARSFVLTEHTVFHLPMKTRFTSSSEPREGLAFCRAEAVPSFLSYFKTLSIGQVPSLEPVISGIIVKRSLPIDRDQIASTRYTQDFLLTTCIRNGTVDHCLLTF